MNKRNLLQSTLALALAVGFSGAVLAQDKPLKIGVTGGPHAQILEQVKKIAEKDGLKIQIVEFSDYVQPNAALAAGDLDANIYQHKPYLDAQVKDRGYKLVKVADTVNFPIGIYSKKVKSLNELKDGAKFGIPNDPTNGGRVLLMLQEKGLIKLKPEAGLKATPLDVTDNPKKIKFVEVDAAQLPRTLDDLEPVIKDALDKVTPAVDAAREKVFTALSDEVNSELDLKWSEMKSYDEGGGSYLFLLLLLAMLALACFNIWRKVRRKTRNQY